jgi:hypothetical protein
MQDTLNTVGFHIDLVRESIKETSDDTEISDLQIYAAMIDIRAMLIDQEITKRKEIDEMYYQTICINLCLDDYAKCCSSFNINKKILRSRTQLPEYITHKYLRPLLVTTVDGENLIPYQKTVNVKWDKFWDIDYTMPTHDITNFNNIRTLIINGNLTLPGVLVTGAFIDPAGAVLSQSCTEDNPDCIDWKDVIFPMPSKLRAVFYSMLIERLAFVKDIPTDVANDAQSNPKQF